MPTNTAQDHNELVRQVARDSYQDEFLVIDDEAKVIVTSEGYQVMAWVFVDKDDV